MNEYVGKICPYCKTAFNENDDVVVCNQCEMPHHKDCWIENQGCTTFGCQGTMKTSDGTPSSVTSNILQYEDPVEEEIIYCARCGTRNVTSSSYCFKCGRQLRVADFHQAEPHFTPAANTPVNHTVTNVTYQQAENQYSPNSQSANQQAGNQYSPNSQSTNQRPNDQHSQSSQSTYGRSGYGYSPKNQSVSDVGLEEYIGKNSEYYIPKFNNLKSQNKTASWNWCSFLFTSYWFLYRKMYGIGAAIFCGTFLLSFLGAFGLWVAIGGRIALGVLSNYMYMGQIENKAAQGKNMNKQYIRSFINRVGGVDLRAPILVYLGYVLLRMLINYSRGYNL